MRRLLGVCLLVIPALIMPSIGMCGDDGWIDTRTHSIGNLSGEGGVCATLAATFAANYASHAVQPWNGAVPSTQCVKQSNNTFNLVYSERGVSHFVTQLDFQNQVWNPKK